MNAILRATIATLVLTATAYGNQSKMAGAWALVDGVKQLGESQEPLLDAGRVYLVIRPDGTFYQAGDLRHSFLDELRKKGDRYATSKTTLEVTQSVYEAERSQLHLKHDSGYALTVEATLLPSGHVAYRSTSPSYGGADLTITATLERIEGARPWQDSEYLLATWTVEGGTPFAVDVSADGRFVVAADLTGQTVSLWDVRQNKLLRVFQGHINDVCAVAISPDGQYVASGSRVLSGRTTEDQALRFWDASTGEQIHHIDAFSTVSSIQFLPGGSSLLAAGAPSDKVGKATAGIWDIQSAKQQSNFLNLHNVRSAVALPNGKSVLCVWLTTAKGPPIGLYDRASGNEKRRIGDNLPTVDVVAVSPKGKRILTCSQEQFVREWDIESGTEIRRIDVDKTWASQIAYLPDGRILTATESDHALHIWDADTGNPISTLAGHRDHIRDMAVSMDGKTIVTCSTDGTVKVWRTPTQEGK